MGVMELDFNDTNNPRVLSIIRSLELALSYYTGSAQTQEDFDQMVERAENTFVRIMDGLRSNDTSPNGTKSRSADELLQVLESNERSRRLLSGDVNEGFVEEW